MSQRTSRSALVPVLILVAAVALWITDAYRQGNLGPSSEPTPQTPAASTEPSQTGNYETYPGCTLIPDRGNDGDSFKARLPDGRTEILRLYFVDAPESAFKTYGGGRNNHVRIADQAADLGGITPEQAIEIGKNATNHTLSLLTKSPFTIHTTWDSPFNDRRYHAFVEISDGNSTRLLHELLIEKGLARIHTKGAPLPDGTTVQKQHHRLLEIQRTAKSTKTGAWRF